MMDFDDVIGAGAAGCVLAGRFSKDRTARCSCWSTEAGHEPVLQSNLSESQMTSSGRRPTMPADVLRLFVFARHAESAANAANMLNSSPSRPVALTARGRTQARALGAQLANLHVDLAVGTRLLRTRQTIDIALDGRQVPTLIESGFDEIRAGDLEGAPIGAYRSWRDQHTPGDRLPHGESIEDALRRYADALQRLLDRKETVTLVVIHDLALRYIAAAAATSSSPSNGTAFPNAVPYLFDEPAARRAATSLTALASSAQSKSDH
jgi:broad specificity phosphatase PhoE